MVAVIKTGHSILRLLNYNEQKVKEGAAVFLGASGYPVDDTHLSFAQKLNRLKNQAALNENVTRNSVHISLNFDPSEQLSAERLREIAGEYMERIGFGDLPYLIYRHFDAGHPHIHLVSVKVRADGSRVNTQNIGRNQSEKARQAIELKYGLVKAEESKQREAYRLKVVNAQKVQYGKSETKRAIGNVLNTVINAYKFSSLPELNAVLKQYNVVADRGGEDSRIFQKRGLVYRVLDELGNKVGVPIKASDFYNRPTLKNIEEKFEANERAKQSHKGRLKNAIDLFFLHRQGSMQEMVTALRKDGIDTVVRQNDEGVIYGLTYVDHQSKCVFNGSTLGKGYSAKGITERCTKGQADGEKIKIGLSERADLATANKEWQAGEKIPGLSGLADALLSADDASRMDYELNRTRKKKKKRQQPERGG